MTLRTTTTPAALACLAALLLTACNEAPQPSAAVPTVPVIVPAAVALSFDTAPTAVTLGESALLSWRADKATTCTASGAWTGSRPLTGSESITPTSLGAQTYTLKCTGTGLAATRSITLTVTSAPVAEDVVLTLGARPLTLELGSPLRLTWNAANADTCTASGAWTGAKATAGTESLTPVMTGALIYRLNCIGAGASDIEQITVTVTDPHAESLAEFLRLRALENNP